MKEPSKQLVKLTQKLFETDSDRATFIQALTHLPAFAPTISWTQPKPADLDWPTLQPLPWQPTQVERLATDIRPGQHPLHNQGVFYCLDFSSVMAAVLIQAIACQFILEVPLIGSGN